MTTGQEFEIPELPFDERYRLALDSAQLRDNLLRFQRSWRQDRDAAFARDAIDFEALRRELKAAKDEAIDHLPAYLEQFQRAAEAAGAVVYLARTCDDLNQYVLNLARRHRTELIVKSKTMVSEETELNHFLSHHGVTAVETDLGEWIVQLAHERPSHMVMPAIHKNKGEVGSLLSSATGQEVSRSDVAEQVRVARQELREAFLRAGMGISGANALVAETGTVMMITNEGNGRLVTSLPPVHVVLAGVEKLVPTVADAITQLRLLPRSATAQRLTTYVTWLTGPASAGKEMHIVLLDNGRTTMRQHPLMRDALRCIRCAACANVCPPYAVVGGHVFGYIYSGAIGLVNTPFHHGLEAGAGPQSLCVSCNACQTVCPVDIPLPRQILQVRAMEAVGDAPRRGVLHTPSRGGPPTRLPATKRAGLRLWRQERLADLALRTGAILQLPLTRGGSYFRLPPPLVGAALRRGPALLRSTSWRTLPALARQPFRDRWEAMAQQPTPVLKSSARGLRVAYFVQCLTDRLYPEMGEATVKLLRACGAEVVFPRGQHCCGLPALDSGDEQTARAMARRTIEVLEGEFLPDYVVSAAASCVVAIAHDFPHLFSGDPVWEERAERLAARTLDLLTFLDRVAQLEPGALADGPSGEPATYHFFCQSANVLALGDTPYRLLRDIRGLELRELPEASVCCGFGGSVSFDHPEMAEHILARKLESVDSTGARVLIADNPGCIMHLRGGMDASGRAIRVRHVAEVLAEPLNP